MAYPPRILQALGEFDLDPCAPKIRPWDMAKKHYTIDDNGLMQRWGGRVWLNPPYGLQTRKWLNKLANHGNGIALTFARTETKMFFESIWNKASAILFIKGRLQFFYNTGEQIYQNAGAPSCLIAYGDENVDILRNCNIDGRFIEL